MSVIVVRKIYIPLSIHHEMACAATMKLMVQTESCLHLGNSEGKWLSVKYLNFIQAYWTTAFLVDVEQNELRRSVQFLLMFPMR